MIHRLPKMLERDWADRMRGAGAAKRRRSGRAYNMVLPRSGCPSCGHGITALREHSRPALPGAARQVLGLRHADFGALSAGRNSRRALFAACACGASAPPGKRWRRAVFCGRCGAHVIDFDTQLLPDDITLPLLWAGLMVNRVGGFDAAARRRDGRRRRLSGAVGRLLAVQADHGKEGMGYGDFKLLAALGAWLGWQCCRRSS